MEYKKIKSYKDLLVWQQGHALVLEIYLVTKGFPREELHGLTNQIRRAVVSITSNIAEGFSRQSPREKIQFYYLALGSLTEVDNQLLIAKDLKYFPLRQYEGIAAKLLSVERLLNRLIVSTKSRLVSSH